MTNMKTFNGIYNLNKRLEKIDKNYRLIYNAKKNSFELYYVQGLRVQKELDFGGKIDTRAILKTRISRRENFAKIIRSIDEFNLKLEENAFYEKLDKSKLVARELINYADKSNRDLSEKEINQIING